MASSICDWIGKEGRNNLGSLNMVRKRYGLEVRQVTYSKREFHFHNDNRQLNNQFASFPVLLQKPNLTAHLLADNCCPHSSEHSGNGEYDQRREEEVA